MSTLLELTPFRLNDGHQLPAIGLGTFGTTSEDRPCPVSEASPDRPGETAT